MEQEKICNALQDVYKNKAEREELAKAQSGQEVYAFIREKHDIGSYEDFRNGLQAFMREGPLQESQLDAVSGGYAGFDDAIDWFSGLMAKITGRVLKS